ncbi:hypothetical protein C8D81_4064 [Enemella evansiae]|nr:hypothetical protein C8D81_4064 [Enemella evansiae]
MSLMDTDHLGGLINRRPGLSAGRDHQVTSSEFRP